MCVCVRRELLQVLRVEVSVSLGRGEGVVAVLTTCRCRWGLGRRANLVAWQGERRTYQTMTRIRRMP